MYRVISQPMISTLHRLSSIYPKVSPVSVRIRTEVSSSQTCQHLPGNARVNQHVPVFEFDYIIVQSSSLVMASTHTKKKDSYKIRILTKTADQPRHLFRAVSLTHQSINRVPFLFPIKSCSCCMKSASATTRGLRSQVSVTLSK
jgi:hypothetical protein